MSAALPDQIDLRRAISGCLAIDGELAVSALPRLREAVSEVGGDVQFSLAFGRDGEGRRVIRIWVATTLRLACQRCLATFDYPISVTNAMAVIDRAEEAEALPEPYDPLLLEDPQRVHPRDLIEDEVLLALPLIPRHAAQDCGGNEAIHGDPSFSDSVVKGPFAALAELRRKHSTH